MHVCTWVEMSMQKSKEVRLGIILGANQLAGNNSALGNSVGISNIISKITNSLMPSIMLMLNITTEDGTR